MMKKDYALLLLILLLTAVAWQVRGSAKDSMSAQRPRGQSSIKTDIPESAKMVQPDEVLKVFITSLEFTKSAPKMVINNPATIDVRGNSLVVKLDEATQVFNRIWGYSITKPSEAEEVFRIINGEHYHLIDTSGIMVYEVKVTSEVPVLGIKALSTVPVTKTLHFFSKDARSAIYKLTKESILTVYKNDPMMKKAVERLRWFEGVDRRDESSGLFRLNRYYREERMRMRMI